MSSLVLIHRKGYQLLSDPRIECSWGKSSRLERSKSLISSWIQSWNLHLIACFKTMLPSLLKSWANIPLWIFSSIHYDFKRAFEEKFFEGGTLFSWKNLCNKCIRNVVEGAPIGRKSFFTLKGNVYSAPKYSAYHSTPFMYVKTKLRSLCHSSFSDL